MVVVCPQRDEFGFSWPEAQPNEIVELPCNDGYTGSMVRTCLDNGSWGPPEDNCVPVSSDSPNITLIVIIVIVVIVVLVVLVVVLLK